MRIVAFLAAVPVVAAAAQDPGRALGPSVNVHYTHASSSKIQDVAFTISTAGSGGAGLTVGYAFSPGIEISMTADIAGGQTVSSSSGAAIGTQRLNQTDATARFQLPLGDASLAPYLLMGYSSRLLSGPLSGGGVGLGVFNEWGGALTYGGGIEVFIARRFALDAAYVRSQGTYSRAQNPDGIGGPLNTSATTSSRVTVGGTWHLGAMAAAPLAPGEDTFSAGQKVRLRVGGFSLIGTVIGVRRDTVVLQQVVYDTARQAEVPRECIASADLNVPVKSHKVIVTRGAFIGAIGVSLVGVLTSSTQSHAPPRTGESFATYALGGAVLGGILGAVSGEHDSRWQSLRLN